MTERDDLAADLRRILRNDAWRMARLAEARALALPDWWLAAGFVRNAVWDHLHGGMSTPLNDIDLIYFDADDTRPERDDALGERLHRRSALPWSVKNQARMHHRQGHAPYESATHAMHFWVECETAVAVRLEANGELLLSAPLGLVSLMAGQLSHNPRHANPAVFHERVARKGWRQRWPMLKPVP
ncbi:nucleotidyltransferase family protein [Salinicola aestuarinus]|uniref:nucleotidyltransferase family protein n=1 Tax=Salinicola aestuarinus TaxID=1949082 RepID=UPI00165FC268|nr:nucleotidyltransferase family protein [Salinicola aestuarinus]